MNVREREAAVSVAVIFFRLNTFPLAREDRN